MSRPDNLAEARRRLAAAVGALPGPALERKMQAEAARAVQALGVREDLAAYPVPEEFAPWRDAYLACLWRAAWKRRGFSGPLTSRAVKLLAEQYRGGPAQVRYAVLAAAARRGAGSLEALALCLGVDPGAAKAALESWQEVRELAGRGQVPLVLFLPPDPTGRQAVGAVYLSSDYTDAREVARAECGPGGALKYARRDTYSVRNALEGRARRL